jgi:lipopolysaccharide biosynthesis glycosyltransferase
MLSVFIGYDPRQPIAYNVCQSSLMRRASKPLAITPLVLKALPIGRTGLTEFTFSRFLVPHLCGYAGRAVFMDADVVVTGDIAELFDLADPDAAVSVVQNVRRFEWPSVMVFNNELCKRLTPELIERGNPFDFGWADKIGALPPQWNHLVGYDQPQEPKLIHYTQGIPCWPETEGCELAKRWHKELSYMNSTVAYKDLMGSSIHDKHVKERLAAA